ncbi:hypothetical protein BSZ14_18230 [Sphingomonas sp. Sph1(2015)]|jgi:hypothetical protein|uniref:hypothetical protein n=1 Tax=Sphingomonas sp. Sph1(2015) TaxID=1628084 RepID=UPI000978532A|nr:hypothetical protein [Sphingomonas sp. Sph1(2015)]OMJ30552.1 hypothetical protein BSZ14_18230 [Sphingomonas sp. Sph1(2015)]
MDRDRDDKPRRLLEQARQLQDQERGRGRSRGGDRADPPTGKFDPAEFDMPPDPSPSATDRARGAADAAQAHSFFSHLDTNIQRILAGFGTLRDLVSDVRASLADAAARDAQRAEAEEARDKAIAARLIDPDALAAHSKAGARQGAAEAFLAAAAELKRQAEADTAARAALNDRFAADAADRRAHETRRRQWDRWWNGALAGFALLVPIAGGYGYYLGNGAGEASGYARARDEVAAASWANTTNGKLARRIDQASEQTIPAIAACPKDHGWHSEKANGRRYCYGTSSTAKMISGWVLP